MIEAFATWFDAQTAKFRTWAQWRWHRAVAGQVMRAMLADRAEALLDDDVAACPATADEPGTIEVWRAGRAVILDGLAMTPGEALDLARELAAAAASIDRAD